MKSFSVFLGRLLLAHIFVLSGIGKIGGYAATQAYMESAGVSGQLLPLVIALELGGSLAVVVGWQTRLASVALAGFSVAAATLFHHNFSDQVQAIMFMKDIAMAGGLLILAAYGPGEWSMDHRRSRRTAF